MSGFDVSRHTNVRTHIAITVVILVASVALVRHLLDTDPEPPAGERIDTRTLSFVSYRGHPPVFHVSHDAAEDRALLAVLAATSRERPPPPDARFDFSRSVLVTMSIPAGCLDPKGAELYADGDRLAPFVHFPDADEPDNCTWPFGRLARFEVPRNRMPAHPVRGASGPALPTGPGFASSGGPSVASEQSLDRKAASTPTRSPRGSVSGQASATPEPASRPAHRKPSTTTARS